MRASTCYSSLLTPNIISTSPIRLLLLVSSLLISFAQLPPAQAWSLPSKPTYDYDLVVIGAGASGLFAAGTASSVGFRTLLIERAKNDDAPNLNVGGDCTNAACVPSKAVRSIARMASTASRNNQALSSRSSRSSSKWLKLARRHADEAVGKVRDRESPSQIGAGPALGLEFVKDCYFTSSHEMSLVCYDNSTWLDVNEPGVDSISNSQVSVAQSKPNNPRERRISSKKFLIATGASPILQDNLVLSANRVDVPYFTYRSLLRPSNGVESFLNLTSIDGRTQNIVLVGGGATACELGQAIYRLGAGDLNVTIVAPAMIPTEDVSSQQSAIKILQRDGLNLHLESRAIDIIKNGRDRFVVLDDNSTTPVDCLVFCMGRHPGNSLRSLNLDKAGISWTENKGVTVNSYLRSTSVPHVYASGDCASAVPKRDRRAIHAGWTGFNAVRNAMLPWFLRSPAAHPHVPRVIYTDPEIASCGMSKTECIQKYGAEGYDSLNVREEGTDRADVEEKERHTGANFVELRAEKITGRILGASACGPAAAEIINEVCLALCNRLTVRDMARTLHSYPSHGYLLYRISMALATQTISGLLAGCGTVGRMLSAQIRILARIVTFLKCQWLPWRKQRRRQLSEWQAYGSAKILVMESNAGETTLLSYFDAYNNATLKDRIISGDEIPRGREDFMGWVEACPSTDFHNK